MGRFFDVLTLSQAAELIGIPPSTLARWADEGRIPFSVGQDGQRVFKREDIEAVSLTGENKPDDTDE